MTALTSKIKYLFKLIIWVLNGYYGATVSLDVPQRVTVLITYFHPVRMKKINHLIRNLLRCTFVEKIIISNHNPDESIEERMHVYDERITVLSQPVKRGCGFRWFVAREFNPEYLIVIDDDFLIFPQQLASLFKFLLDEPEIPHGLSGMNYLASGEFEFRDKENGIVDFLCEVYAITREQLNHYMEISSVVLANENIARIVNATADFVLVSQTGCAKPKIHNVGRLLRDESFQMKGVAVHKEQQFNHDITQVLRAIGIHTVTERIE